MMDAAPQLSAGRPGAGRDLPPYALTDALFRLVPRSMVMTVAAAGLTALTVAADIPPGRLVLWFLAVFGLSLARYGLHLRYVEAPQRRAPRAWENRFAAGALAMGLMWGALTLLGTLPDVKQALVAMLFCVVLLSSSSILAASLRAFAAFAIPVLVALFAMLLANPGLWSWTMVAICTLFLASVIGTFAESRRALLASLELNEQYRESFRRQRLIFEAAHSGIAITRNRVIVDYNPRAAEMFGYGRDELLGQSSRVLFFDDQTWNRVGEAAIAGMRAGKAFSGEQTLRAKSGAPVICDVSMDALLPGNPDAGIVILLNDITERKRLENSLAASLAEQRALFDHAPVGIVFARDRKLVSCNERFLSLFGYAFEEVAGRDARHLYASEARWHERNAEIARAFARGEHVAFEEELLDKQGRTVWCQVRGAQVAAGEGAFGSAVFTIADASERKRLEITLRESREQLDLVVAATRAGAWDWNIATGEVSLSPRFLEILRFAPGTPPAEVGPILARVHPDDAARAREQWIAHLKTPAPVSRELRLRTRDGAYVWVRADGLSLHDASRRAVRSIGAIADITALKERAAEIEHLALHDALTGLPNRRLLEDRLEFALTSARRNRTPLAVMLIDLDGFKSINDAHGHDAGDAVLRGVAGRLRACVRAADTVSRTGGDEFVIVAERAEPRAAVRALAHKVLEAIREPLAWQGHTLVVGGSIGVALYPTDADHPAQLVRMADEAMYRVKEAGRNGVRFHGER